MFTFHRQRSGALIVRRDGAVVGLVKQQGGQWVAFNTDFDWTGTRHSSKLAAAETLVQS